MYADLPDGRDLNPSPGFSLANLRLLLSILVPRGWSATRKTTDYTAVIDAIRRHVTSGTGECPWIVDSSKSLDALNALSRSPRIELRVIHLVRDGRGVAISFLRRGRNPLAALAAWMSVNALLFLYIRRHGIPCLRVDYRSLCEDGPATVAEIRRLLGLEGVPRDAIQLGPRHSYHLMEGNRKIRDLASGEREFVGLRYHGDMSGLSRRERVVARLVTDPLYKFLVSGRKLARERVLIR